MTKARYSAIMGVPSRAEVEDQADTCQSTSNSVYAVRHGAAHGHIVPPPGWESAEGGGVGVVPTTHLHLCR